MLTSNPADTDHQVASLITNRWSPLAIDSRELELEKILSLLEAARWAPSSFNEQPWFYVLGKKGDKTHEQLASCLMSGNSWAAEAPVLMLSVAKLFFDHKHKPNRHAMHDTGAASVLMHVQATELGLAMHQMAGFDVEKARELFKIGEDYEPAVMIAVGYPGEASALSPDLQKRESMPRSRKSVKDLIWEL